MTRLYDFASRLSGCLAGVCAVLALLATPSSARADQLSACDACCQGQPDYPSCVYGCVNNLYGPCQGAYSNSCPGAMNSCSINNENMEGCLNLICGNGTKFCDCTWNETNKTCNCPAYAISNETTNSLGVSSPLAGSHP